MFKIKTGKLLGIIMATVCSITCFSSAFTTKVSAASNSQTQIDRLISYARNKIGSTDYYNLCEKFTGEVYASVGVYTNSGCARDSYNQWCVSTQRDPDLIPIGATLWFDTSEWGHSCIYVGNNKMIHAVETVKEQEINSWWWDRYLGWGFPNNEYLDGTYVMNKDSFHYTFDSEVYHYKYPDLQNAFHFNKVKLLAHMLDFGLREGRTTSIFFDVKTYVNSSSDLKAVFGNDYVAAYKHMLTYGYKECRKLSPVYDCNYYSCSYTDLRRQGFSAEQYLQHFYEHGVNEMRRASLDFYPINYKSRYQDLIDAYGDNSYRYYYHYTVYGIDEHRKGN